MARNQVNFPTLLRDGAWREQKVKGQYWPRYMRRRWGKIQLVTWNESFGPEERTAWVLESGARFIGHGSLDKVLYLAETLSRGS